MNESKEIEQPPKKSTAPRVGVERIVILDDPKKWLESMEYLPEMLRDFHDQKDLFKAMHLLYEKGQNKEEQPRTPTWVDGQCYVLDWFLWYMAGRGYTLQKSRKKLDFWDFEDWREVR